MFACTAGFAPLNAPLASAREALRWLSVLAGRVDTETAPLNAALTSAREALWPLSALASCLHSGAAPLNDPLTPAREALRQLSKLAGRVGAAAEGGRVRGSVPPALRGLGLFARGATNGALLDCAHFPEV